mmetsp:Transcript_11526/g.29184  ORF Transcript_11526/g.29184 Transcript_11526/m.29184 type:complete len:319 (+) Transcript_11526:2619-3575(+)
MASADTGCETVRASLACADSSAAAAAALSLASEAAVGCNSRAEPEEVALGPFTSTLGPFASTSLLCFRAEGGVGGTDRMAVVAAEGTGEGGALAGGLEAEPVEGWRSLEADAEPFVPDSEDSTFTSALANSPSTPISAPISSSSTPPPPALNATGRGRRDAGVPACPKRAGEAVGVASAVTERAGDERPSVRRPDGGRVAFACGLARGPGFAADAGRSAESENCGSGRVTSGVPCAGSGVRGEWAAMGILETNRLCPGEDVLGEGDRFARQSALVTARLPGWPNDGGSGEEGAVGGAVRDCVDASGASASTSAASATT